MIGELLKVALDNYEFYKKEKVDELILRQNFQAISELIQELIGVLDEIKGFAGEYDLDEKTPGNGYWSFVFILDSAVECILKISKHVQKKRKNIFFRKSFYEK